MTPKWFNQAVEELEEDLENDLITYDDYNYQMSELETELIEFEKYHEDIW